MSFSVTPVTGFPPATPTEPTRGIQFQWEGVDIGRRNTDTVNLKDLSGTLDVTIGVGEHVNVLTVGSVAGELIPGDWLDTFTGTAGTTLSAHVQDTPCNGSVWGFLGEAALPSLYEGGYASTDAEAPGNFSAAATRFDTGVRIELAWGWEIEFTSVYELITESPLVNTFTLVGFTGVLVLETNFSTGDITATLGGNTAVIGAASPSLFELFPMRVVMNQTTAEVYLNDVLVHTFTSGTFSSPIYATIELTGENVVSARADRVGFSGTVIEVIPT